jgi:hypothetical protein
MQAASLLQPRLMTNQLCSLCAREKIYHEQEAEKSNIYAERKTGFVEE